MKDLFSQPLGRILTKSSQVSFPSRSCLSTAKPPWPRVSLFPRAVLIQWLISEGANRPDPPLLPKDISEGPSQLQSSPWIRLTLLVDFISANFTFCSTLHSLPKTLILKVRPSKPSACQSLYSSLLPDKPTHSTFFDLCLLSVITLFFLANLQSKTQNTTHILYPPMHQ